MMITPQMLAQGFSLVNTPQFYVGAQFLQGFQAAQGQTGFATNFYGATPTFSEQTAAAFNMPHPAMLQARAATMAPALITPMATEPYRTLQPIPTMSFLNTLMPEYMSQGYARQMLPTEAYLEARSQFPATTTQMLGNFGISTLGTLLGAAVGSLIPIPGVGTAIGALGGNLLGLGLGDFFENVMALEDVMAVRQIGNRLFRNRNERAYTPLSMSESSEILNEILRSARSEPVFDVEDVKSLFTEVAQSNLIVNSQYTVEKFKQDFAKLLETNRLISQALRTTSEDALELMKGFANLGLTNPVDMQKIAFTARQAAWVTGTTEEFQMQQITAGMQMANQMGVYGPAVNMFAGGSGYLTNFLTNEIPNADSFTSLMGGTANVQKEATQFMTMLYTNPNFAYMMLGTLTNEQGQLSRDRLNRVLSGDISAVETTIQGQGLAATMQLNSPEQIWAYISQQLAQNPNVFNEEETALIQPALMKSFIDFQVRAAGGNTNLVVNRLSQQGYGSVQFLNQLMDSVYGETGDEFLQTVLEQQRKATVDRISNAAMAYNQIPLTKRVQNFFESFKDIFRNIRTDVFEYFERTSNAYYRNRNPYWDILDDLGNFGLNVGGDELYTTYYEQYYTPDRLARNEKIRKQYTENIKKGQLTIFGITFPEKFSTDIIKKIDDFLEETIQKFTGGVMSQAEYTDIQKEIQNIVKEEFSPFLTQDETTRASLIGNQEFVQTATAIDLLKEIVDQIATGNQDAKELNDKIQKFLAVADNKGEQQIFSYINQLLESQNISEQTRRELESAKQIIQNEMSSRDYMEYIRTTDYQTRMQQAQEVFNTNNPLFNFAAAATGAHFQNADLNGMSTQDIINQMTSYFQTMFQVTAGRVPSESELEMFRQIYFPNEQLQDLDTIGNVARTVLARPESVAYLYDIKNIESKQLDKFFKEYNKIVEDELAFREKTSGEGYYLENEKLKYLVNIYDEQGNIIPTEQIMNRLADFSARTQTKGIDIISLARFRSKLQSDEQYRRTISQQLNVPTEQLSNIVQLGSLEELFGLMEENAPEDLWKTFKNEYGKKTVGLITNLNLENILPPVAQQQMATLASTYTRKIASTAYQKVLETGRLNIQNNPTVQSDVRNFLEMLMNNESPQRIFEFFQESTLGSMGWQEFEKAIQPATEYLFTERGLTPPNFDALRLYLTGELGSEEAYQMFGGSNMLSNAYQTYQQESYNYATSVVMGSGGQLSEGVWRANTFLSIFPELMEDGLTRAEALRLTEIFSPSDFTTIFSNIRNNQKLSRKEKKILNQLEDFIMQQFEIKSTLPANIGAMITNEASRSGEQFRPEDYFTPEGVEFYETIISRTGVLSPGDVPFQYVKPEVIEEYFERAGYNTVEFQENDILQKILDTEFEKMHEDQSVREQVDSEGLGISDEIAQQFNDSTNVFANGVNMFNEAVNAQKTLIANQNKALNSTITVVESLKDQVATLNKEVNRLAGRSVNTSA